MRDYGEEPVPKIPSLATPDLGELIRMHIFLVIVHPAIPTQEDV